MGTTWNIDLFVTPKRDKNGHYFFPAIRDKLENMFNSPQCSVEIEKESDRVVMSCVGERGSYGWGDTLPGEVMNELGDDIEEGELYMKEVEPASGAFPADVYVDLVKRIRRDRSSAVLEGVL
jgi:hypothetical protein